MVGSLPTLIVAAFVSCLLAAGTAAAQNPAPGSPPGAVYELPTDSGRRDGAPRPNGSGSAGLSESTYRSENNFGTSAQVPGDPRAKGDAGAGAGGAAGGGGAVVGVLSDASLETGDPNTTRSIALMVLIVAVGLLLGVASVRGRGPA